METQHGRARDGVFLRIRSMRLPRVLRDTMAGVPLRAVFGAEQTMSMPASTRRWTVDEVRAMQDESRAWPRYELIDGELLVTPSPRLVHQRAVKLLLFALHPWVEANGVGEVLMSPADIELESGTIVQPDVFVVARSSALPIASWRDVRALAVAAEVTSPSTARWDRVKKRRFFSRARVDQYWVIDLDARVVERTTPGDPKVEVLDELLEWHPSEAAVPFRLDLPPFFARVHGDA
jgi:Uma2 family endonuclease